MNNERDRIWDKFPVIAGRVVRTHLDVRLHGHHDWSHAFRVGDTGAEVALDEWKDEHIADLAGIAGLTHNANRIIQKIRKVGRQRVPTKTITELVQYWLRGCLLRNDREEIVKAVLKHGQKNSPSDSEVQVALMDGDRIVNLDIDLLLRSGQFYHDLSAVDLKNWLSDPKATYRKPRSALRDANYSLDWAAPTSDVCVRTRLGFKMAQERARIFRTFFMTLEEQLKNEGMRPLPEFKFSKKLQRILFA